jgi:large subunit ribosomal protein L17
MRHRKAGLKLNRTSSHRNAMFRNMVTSLFKHERIRTTDTKAKGLRHWADHLITLAKRGDLHARRQALSIIREKNVVYKLFDEAVERFGSIFGGYKKAAEAGKKKTVEKKQSVDDKKEDKTEKKKATED